MFRRRVVRNPDLSKDKSGRAYFFTQQRSHLDDCCSMRYPSAKQLFQLQSFRKGVLNITKRSTMQAIQVNTTADDDVDLSDRRSMLYAVASKLRRSHCPSTYVKICDLPGVCWNLNNVIQAVRFACS